MSPPPPPPPPAAPPLPAHLAQSTVLFERVNTNGGVAYKFNLNDTAPSSSIPLKTAVRAFAPGAMAGKTVSADSLLLSLGKLRTMQHVLSEYNIAVTKLDELNKSSSDTPVVLDGQCQLFRHHAMELFTVLGYQVQSPTESVTITGLADLIASIEDLYSEALSMHRTQISAGTVHFEGLGELFPPGTIVSGATALGHGVARAGYLVKSGFFEEKRTLFGKEKCFRLELEYIVNFGRYFATVCFEEIFSGWQGSQTKGISELPYFPADAETIASFTKRGDRCISMSSTSDTNAGCRFVQYSLGGFYPHQQQRRAQDLSSASTGRIVIDCERGLTLGHYASQGSTESDAAMMNAANRYKRALGTMGTMVGGTAGAKKAPPNTEGMLMLESVPTSLRALLWPALVGFSFATKGWGHVLVDSLEEIAFNDSAFDLLVMAPEKKRLIRALVTFGGRSTQSKFQDIIAGKSGGSVFLLHGPPGVGKTLTAEAIAEYLHRPLYYVTMGELGTSPGEMEKKLGEVLDLCTGWDALAIIDEADVFLEKRASVDIVRNAMVCVMLRLIEYYQGILFLTTNRILVFDPAFESRVTVALKYDDLPLEAREKVWRNLIANLSGVTVGDVDYGQLAETIMNGRQIKNAIRLALALAEDAGSLLTQDLIEETLAVTALGRLEMVKDVAEF